MISQVKIGSDLHDIVSNGTIYGECSTAAATAAKAVTISVGVFNLYVGAKITIKFTNKNTSSEAPTLNVNSSGAKPIYLQGSALSPKHYWEANSILQFVYTGTSWEIVGENKSPTLDIFYIEGSGSSTGTWLGSHEKITEYVPGLTIAYKLDAAGSSDGVTLNINGLGAKTVYRNASTNISTAYPVGSVALFIYTEDDGVGVWKAADYDANTTYTNVKLGHGYATCSTAAGTAAKTASLSSYTLTTGGIVSVRFSNAITVANPTLNINSKGAKAIYWNNAALTDTTLIEAGDIVTFIYSTYYRIINILKHNSQKYAASGHTHTVEHTPAGTIGNKSLTPAGSVSSSFTGTAHKHTFTGTAVTSNKPDTTNTTSIYSITGVGTLPSLTFSAGTLPSASHTAASLTASVANQCLTLTFAADTHSFSAGTLPSATFSAGTLPTRSSAISMPNTNHTHSVTAAGTLDNVTATGSITSTFTGTAAEHNHSFTGTKATLTTSGNS